MSAAEAEAARIQRAYTRYATEPKEVQRRDRANPGLRLVAAEWHNRLGARLFERGQIGPETRILDVGCGAGSLLAWFQQAGVAARNCTGIDLMPARVERAAALIPDATIICADATAIPAPAASYDVVTMSMVLSSVLDPLVSALICAEASRVLAPGGTIVVYDTRYPNPRNADVRRLSRRDLGRHFPGASIETETLTLLPPLARGLGRWAPRFYGVLAAVPPLRARFLAFVQWTAT